jgi:uncharacterized protein (DUF1015 family)
MKIKPFAGVRPPKDLADQVASRPYDVLNSVEAKIEAGEKSLLHIIKPEIDFDPIADEHSQIVYDKAVKILNCGRNVVGWSKMMQKCIMFMRKQWMDVHSMVW